MLRRLASDWISHWARQAFRTLPRQPRQRTRLRPAADTLEPRLLLAAPVANPEAYSLPTTGRSRLSSVCSRMTPMPIGIC